MSIASCNINVNSSNDRTSKDEMPCVLNLFRFSNISLLIFFVYFFNVFAVAIGIFIFNVSFCLGFFCLVSITCSCTGSFIGSCIVSFIGSCIGSSSFTFIGSCIVSFIGSSSFTFVGSFIGSFIGSILFLISSKGKVNIIECSSIRSCGSLYSKCKKSKMSFSVLNSTFTIFSCFTFVSFVSFV